MLHFQVIGLDIKRMDMYVFNKKDRVIAFKTVLVDDGM